MNYNIKYLCDKFKISRSTLLYYDSIGLLTPSGRSESNYRVYSEADIKRLERINIYRQVGLPLKDIKKVLEETSGNNDIDEALENRLRELNEISQNVKLQQRLILSMLQNEKQFSQFNKLDKTSFVEMLYSIGLGGDALDKIHASLEALNPEWHQQFLESLSFTEEEIRVIRGLG